MTTTGSRETITRRTVLACIAGNLIEWYEFSVYGFLVRTIAGNFFAWAEGDAATSLMRTYAMFALVYLCRPIGAVVFGRFGDQVGRVPALFAALLTTTASTVAIGLLPTYARIGAAAPVLLMVLRFVQGICASGEFGGAVALLIESAPRHRRGYFGAWQSLSVALGLLMGAGVVALLSLTLSEAQLDAWGWRIPFLLALPMGAISLWLRRQVDESALFRRAREANACPTRSRLAQASFMRQLLRGVGAIMGWSAAGYAFLVVLPAYLQVSLHTSACMAMAAAVLANLGFAAAILPAGRLGDRLGHRTVMITGLSLIALLSWPLLQVLRDPAAALLTRSGAVLLAGAAVGLLAGPGPAMLAELFPTASRYTGLGVTYSVSNAIFSGAAGLVLAISSTRGAGDDMLAYYVGTVSLLSALSLLRVRAARH